MYKRQEYNKEPQVTRKRLYIETMEYVLANTSKVVMQVKGGNNLMYIPLDRLMESRGSNQNTADNDAPIDVRPSPSQQPEIRLRTPRGQGGR